MAQFKSIRARSYHNDFIRHLPIHAEKGIRYSDPTIEELNLAIWERKIRGFFEPTIKGSLNIVWEFYSHADIANLHRVYVRGTYVDCSASAINFVFGCRSVPNCFFQKYRTTTASLGNLIYRYLDGSYPAENDQRVLASFSTMHSTPAVRLLHWIIDSRFIPSPPNGRMSMDQAVLAYCILQCYPVDFRKIIHKRLRLCHGRERLTKLYFPRTICYLAARANIPWLEGDEPIPNACILELREVVPLHGTRIIPPSPQEVPIPVRLVASVETQPSKKPWTDTDDDSASTSSTQSGMEPHQSMLREVIALRNLVKELLDTV